MKNDFFPSSDDSRMIMLNNFALKLATYQTVLGFTPAQVTAIQNDAENFAYAHSNLEKFKTYTKNLTKYKNILRDGTAENSPLSTIPVAPTAWVFPKPVVANIFGRLRKTIQTIKNHANYNDAIGNDLGIIGTELDGKTLEVKPVLNYYLEGGHPKIGYKKSKMQGIKLFVDKGTGYQLTAVSTISPYADISALPAVGTSAVWKYKAIYLRKDQEVGQMSDEMTVTVLGI